MTFQKFGTPVKQEAAFEIKKKEDVITEENSTETISEKTSETSETPETPKTLEETPAN